METIYDKLGPEKLQILVTNFYDLVQESEIKDLFTNDFDEIRNKQFMFLSQFLGGPQLYTIAFGHPKMRMRHLPHQITNRGKEVWLECMKKAIDTLDIESEFKEVIYNCFPQVAQHMVNS